MPTPIIDYIRDHTGRISIRFLGWDYKAPHALRGTPKKPRRRMSSALMPRQFKGHRP